MDQQNLFILDSSSGVHLEYLAEGAANIIYKPTSHPQTPNVEADLNFVPDGITTTPLPTDLPSLMADPRLEGKLIRLRKDLSTVLPVQTSLDHFKNVISPLFHDSQVVSQTLLKISTEVIKDLNTELREMEAQGKRAAKRHGTYLAENEAYGTLITDMSSDSTSVSIEFKPKWLVQSPSAPTGSKRCRTCALRAMRLVTQSGHHGAENGSFCPLKLVSGDLILVNVTVDQILASPKYSQLRDQNIKSLLMSWIMESPVLQRLKQLQMDLDPAGLLAGDLASQDFLTTMTLRDCTLFLKASFSHVVKFRLLKITRFRFHALVQDQSKPGLEIWISRTRPARKPFIGEARNDSSLMKDGIPARKRIMKQNRMAAIFPRPDHDDKTH